MTAPVVADIVALRPHALRPDRVLSAGEVFARIQFRDEADREFFANHFRWSAFKVAPVDEVKTRKPRTPKADVVEPTPVAPVTDAPTPAAE